MLYYECINTTNTVDTVNTLGIYKRIIVEVRRMIFLDYQDRRPLYEQITERYRQLILNGVLEAGSKMPSVRQLAIELAINPNTIQRAYMELEQQGLIYPVRGKGNFVADTEEIRRQGITEYEQEFQQIVSKGQGMGVSLERMEHMLLTYYKNLLKEESE